MSDTTNIPTYTLSRIIERLVAYAAVPEIANRNAWLIIGPPGTGKTWAAEEVARRLHWHMEEVPIGAMEKGDVAIPVPNLTDQTFDMIPAVFWTRIKPNTVVVLDEYLNADPNAVQPLRPAYPGGSPHPHVANHVLPTPLLWVMTGNPREAGGRQVSPLSNPAERSRVRPMLIDTNETRMAADWVETYAIKHGVDDRMIGFLRRHSNWIIKPPPKEAYGMYPNPRSWTAAAGFIEAMAKGQISAEDARDGVVDTVGLEAQLALWQDMAENMLAPAEDYLWGRVAMPKLLWSQMQAVIRAGRYAIDNADQRTMSQFFKVSADWAPEAVAAVLSLMQTKPAPWFVSAGVLSALEENADFQKRHYSAYQQVRKVWQDNPATAAVAPAKSKKK